MKKGERFLQRVSQVISPVTYLTADEFKVVCEDPWARWSLEETVVSMCIPQLQDLK